MKFSKRHSKGFLWILGVSMEVAKSYEGQGNRKRDREVERGEGIEIERE